MHLPLVSCSSPKSRIVHRQGPERLKYCYILTLPRINQSTQHFQWQQPYARIERPNLRLCGLTMSYRPTSHQPEAALTKERRKKGISLSLGSRRQTVVHHHRTNRNLSAQNPHSSHETRTYPVTPNPTPSILLTSFFKKGIPLADLKKKKASPTYVLLICETPPPTFQRLPSQFLAVFGFPPSHAWWRSVRVGFWFGISD